MSTFSEQIAFWAGSVSTLTNEVTQALRDTQLEIVHHMLANRPSMAPEFADTKTVDDDNGVSTDGLPVLYAFRGNYPCTFGKPELWASYGLDGSIHEATSGDPVIYAKDGLWFVKPTPVAQEGKRGYVTHVAVDAGLLGSDSTAENFPASCNPLLVYGAAIRVIDAKMADEIASVPSSITLPTAPVSAVFAELEDTVSALAPPDALDLSSYISAVPDSADIDFSDVPTVVQFTPPTLSRTAPTFTIPQVGGATEDLTGTITAATIGTDLQDVSNWFDTVSQYIETEEDVELASATLHKINSYLSAYSTQLNADLAKFNSEVEAYRGELNDYQAELQSESARVSSDLQTAQQKISQAVAKYESELGADLRLLNEKAGFDVQEFRANLDRALAVFKADVDQFAVEAQRIAVSNQNEAQRIQSDLAVYAATIQGESAKFAQDVQSAQMTYNWLADNRARVDKLYKEGLAAMFGVKNV